MADDSPLTVTIPAIDLTIDKRGAFYAFQPKTARGLAWLDQQTNAGAWRECASLRAALSRELAAKNAILDGEIVCLDAEGRSVFKALLSGRQSPVYAAFDVLWVNGQDLRDLPLVERKKRLRGIVPAGSPHLLHWTICRRRAASCSRSPVSRTWKAWSASG